MLFISSFDTTANEYGCIKFKDEIHEREQKTDYLLIALRQALKNRDDLRVSYVLWNFENY